MSNLNTSMNKLARAVEQRLGSVTKSVTTKELGEINKFLKEAQGVMENLNALSGPRVEEIEYDEAGELFLDAFVDGCLLIKNMFLLLDDNKIKETQSEWVIEEVKDYMDKAKEMFGPRIPPLPEMRPVSKPKKKK